MKKVILDIQNILKSWRMKSLIIIDGKITILKT